MVAAFDFGQCADKALDLLRAVTDGEISQYIADVAKLDLNVVLVAQDVIDLNARKTDVQRVDAEFCRIKVKN